MTPPPDILPDDLEALKAALLAERSARLEAEARASGAEAMVAHLKLMIARLKRERFGPSSEHRRRLLDQLELHWRSWRRPPPRMPVPPKRPSWQSPAGTRAPLQVTADADRFGRRCRRICRVSASSSRRPRSAHAVRASWSSLARTSPRRWR